jgi:hypothetical protein
MVPYSGPRICYPCRGTGRIVGSDTAMCAACKRPIDGVRVAAPDAQTYHDNEACSWKRLNCFHERKLALARRDLQGP